MNTLITPEIMFEIQERSAASHSTREIQAWLASLGIKYSHVSISRVINKHRKARYEITESIMRPILEKQIHNDLDILQEMIMLCRETIRLAEIKKDKRLVLATMARMKEFLTLSFKVKGISTDDESDKKDDSIDYDEVIHRFDFTKKEE